jgi:type IV pilus assembly protein PilN
MIQINLLPARVRKKRDNVNQFIYAYGLCIVAALFVMAFLWYSQGNEVTSLNTRLAQVQAEVGKYAKFEQILKDLKQKIALVEKKKSVILGLQTDRDTMVRMLALVSVLIPPEEMWFEKFNQTARTLTLEGVALNNEVLAEFLRNLESSPYVEKGSVNLTHSRQKIISNQKLREFQVTCRFFPFSEMQKRLKAQPS